MPKPTKRSWNLLKRIGRYIVGHGRFVQAFKWCSPVEKVTGFGDSDWAGDKVSLKSTSGGAVTLGPHTVKTWSTSQQTLAMSSGEAELYAVTKAAAQALGIMSMLGDFGINPEGEVKSDSTAAIGIVCREGLGRTRHIKVQYLWLQERVQEKDLKIVKVGTSLNIADLMTKHLKKEDRERLMKLMNMRIETGRAESSLAINAVKGKRVIGDKWIKRMEVKAFVDELPGTKSISPRGG